MSLLMSGRLTTLQCRLWKLKLPVTEMQTCD